MKTEDILQALPSKEDIAGAMGLGVHALRPGRAVSVGDNAPVAQQPSERPPRPSLLTADLAGDMSRIERVFERPGEDAWKARALAVLRCWEVDPMLDSDSRARATGLIWKLQPNGWDEV